MLQDNRNEIEPTTPTLEARPHLSWEAAMVDIGNARPELVDEHDTAALIGIAARDYPRHVLEDMARELLVLRFNSLFLSFEERTRRRLKREKALKTARRRQARIAKRAAVQVVHAIERNLFDMVLANDKRLGDCTRAELEAEGGWLLDVARQMEANRTAQECLSLAELWEIRWHRVERAA